MMRRPSIVPIVLGLLLAAFTAAAQVPGVAASRPRLTPAQEARYQQGLRLYQQRQYPQASEIYINLAREAPYGVLGMVVASLASTAPTPQRAAAAVADADAHPDDKLKQFIAGVLSHYAAHVSARSVEEKRPLYEQAIRYLERTRPTYDFEARVFIYLAVSHFRLGHQQLAEPLVEHAVELAREDPDAYYCRAEIFQRTNVRRSIEDIDIYLRMNTQNEARGAVGDPGKTARVRAMRDHLIAVSEGRAPASEIFDPVQHPGNGPGNNGGGGNTGGGGGGHASPADTMPGPAGEGSPPARRSARSYGFGLFGVGLAAWLGVRVFPKLWKRFRASRPS